MHHGAPWSVEIFFNDEDDIFKKNMYNWRFDNFKSEMLSTYMYVDN